MIPILQIFHCQLFLSIHGEFSNLEGAAYTSYSKPRDGRYPQLGDIWGAIQGSLLQTFHGSLIFQLHYSCTLLRNNQNTSYQEVRFSNTAGSRPVQQPAQVPRRQSEPSMAKTHTRTHAHKFFREELYLQGLHKRCQREEGAKNKETYRGAHGCCRSPAEVSICFDFCGAGESDAVTNVISTM